MRRLLKKNITKSLQNGVNKLGFSRKAEREQEPSEGFNKGIRGEVEGGDVMVADLRGEGIIGTEVSPNCFLREGK